MNDSALTALQLVTAGRYTIERTLGRGGMATVYLARDLRHDRLVALKHMDAELAASVGAERFLREINVAARLQHPHIVPVFDSGGEGSQLYYTMPYIAGESLRDLLDREPRVPVRLAVNLARQVASALSAAHAEGVVHRDIKPENILVRDGQALVTDFGIARAVGDRTTLTGTGVSLGTPTYMSPEQVVGDPVDGRSDVFSLGCVLFEMLTGAPPFVGPTLQATLTNRLIEPAAPLRTARPDAPERLEAALVTALAVNPDQRFETAAAFGAALDLAHDTTPFRARAPAPAPLRARSITTRPLVLAAVLVVGGAAAVTLAVMRPSASSVGNERSIAVMDFLNRSSDSADAYLASGLTDEVTSRLGDLDRLRVKGRRAVAAAAATLPGDYRALGRALDVRYLVEGSVRRDGARIRISVTLVTSGDGFRIWSQDYDGTASDLMLLQEEIARSVARRVAGELLPGERASLAGRRTHDAVAYDHLLRGNFLLAQRNADATARAIGQYDAAIARDPGFVLALARAAYAHALVLDWGWTLPGVPRDTVLTRGLLAATRALALDSTTAEAWLARGYLLTFANPTTFAGVQDAFARAVAHDSLNAEIHHQYGWVLHEMGRDSLALVQYHRALASEPERASTLRQIAMVHLFAQRDGDAERWLDSTLRVDPGFYSAYGLRGLLRLRRGDIAGAREDGEMSLRLRASDPLRGEFVLALADVASGNPTDARRRLARMHAHIGGGPVNVWDAWYVALVHLSLDDRKATTDLLERVPEKGLLVRLGFSDLGIRE
ncbi:MAG: protein kinase [Gemmatimonadaceae bacterium]